MSAEVEELVRMARVQASDAAPWFAPALFRSTPIVAFDCPSIAAIDRNLNVYFNPVMVKSIVGECIDTVKLPVLAFIWVHEISHWLREHFVRAQEIGADPTTWNIAADLEINDYLPPGTDYPTDPFRPILPNMFKLPVGMVAEWYYDQLRSNEKSDRGEGVTGDDGTGHGKSEASGWKDEGSGVHGRPRPWEIEEESDSRNSIAPLEAEMIRESVAREIQTAKSHGDVPAGWSLWADAILKPKVDWKAKFRRIATGKITIGAGQKLDYSFGRPNRRAACYAPFLRPILSGKREPIAAVVVDTSGSMSRDDLNRALGEARGVLEALRTRIAVIPCDKEAYEPAKILCQSDLVRLAREGLRGGGGTDMVAGIEAAMALKPAVDAVIVLTDGHTPYPAHRYSAPVFFGIFCASDLSENLKPPMPPWKPGDVVAIPIKETR